MLTVNGEEVNLGEFKVGQIYLIEEDTSDLQFIFSQRSGFCVGDQLKVVNVDREGTATFKNLTRPDRVIQVNSGFFGLHLLDSPEEKEEELAASEEAAERMNSQMYDRDGRIPSAREQAFADKQEHEQLIKQSKVVEEANRIQKRDSAVLSAMAINDRPVSRNGK